MENKQINLLKTDVSIGFFQNIRNSLSDALKPQQALLRKKNKELLKLKKNKNKNIFELENTNDKYLAFEELIKKERIPVFSDPNPKLKWSCIVDSWIISEIEIFILTNIKNSIKCLGKKSVSALILIISFLIAFAYVESHWGGDIISDNAIISNGILLSSTLMIDILFIIFAYSIIGSIELLCKKKPALYLDILVMIILVAGGIGMTSFFFIVADRIGDIL
jgi:hypothetical protein